MNDVTDITVKILGEIRDEIRGTNQRLDQTNQRLEQTNQRLDQTRGELRDELRSQVNVLVRRQTEAEVRLATEVVALAGAVDRTNQLLRERLDERDRIDDIERRVSALERGGPKH